MGMDYNGRGEYEPEEDDFRRPFGYHWLPTAIMLAAIAVFWAIGIAAATGNLR